MQLRNLVVIKRQPPLQVPVLIERLFIAPDGIVQHPIFQDYVEISRGPLERTLRPRIGGLQHFHFHIAAREVKTSRTAILVEAKYVSRLCYELAIGGDRPKVPYSPGLYPWLG